MHKCWTQGRCERWTSHHILHRFWIHKLCTKSILHIAFNLPNIATTNVKCPSSDTKEVCKPDIFAPVQKYAHCRCAVATFYEGPCPHVNNAQVLVSKTYRPRTKWTASWGHVMQLQCLWHKHMLCNKDFIEVFRYRGTSLGRTLCMAGEPLYLKNTFIFVKRGFSEKARPILRMLVEIHTPIRSIYKHIIFWSVGWRPPHPADNMVKHSHILILSHRVLTWKCHTKCPPSGGHMKSRYKRATDKYHNNRLIVQSL